MYKLKEISGKLVLHGRWGDETIHLVHCSDNLSDLTEDCANIYLVAEECTNFARTHLVTDFSEEEALEQIANYLYETENVSEPHLIGVFQVVIETNLN